MVGVTWSPVGAAQRRVRRTGGLEFFWADATTLRAAAAPVTVFVEITGLPCGVDHRHHPKLRVR